MSNLAQNESSGFRASVAAANKWEKAHALHRCLNHLCPGQIYELLLQSPAGQEGSRQRMRGISALYETDERLRVVESFQIESSGDLPRLPARRIARRSL